MFIAVQSKVFQSWSQISEGKSCLMECCFWRVTSIFGNLKEKNLCNCQLNTKETVYQFEVYTIIFILPCWQKCVLGLIIHR